MELSGAGVSPDSDIVRLWAVGSFALDSRLDPEGRPE
jgi:hypothetical protein